MAERKYYPLPRETRGPFDKVLFLDIDGVLNNDHYDPEKPAVDEEMVANLAYIIRETHAHIVLSSSWKFAWRKLEENDFVPQGRRDEDVLLLKQLLDRWDLVIEDFTPESDTGPYARPHEIRAWLLNHCEVTSFVILDDDDFWTFGWMNKHFVCTATPTGSVKWPGYLETTRGLTLDHAREAVSILNDGCPLSYSQQARDKDDIYRKRIRERKKALGTQKGQ